jgi:hypothetical protein
MSLPANKHLTQLVSKINDLTKNKIDKALSCKLLLHIAVQIMFSLFGLL